MVVEEAAVEMVRGKGDGGDGLFRESYPNIAASSQSTAACVRLHLSPRSP